VAVNVHNRMSDSQVPPVLQATKLQIPAVGMHPAFRCNLQLDVGQLAIIHCDDKERGGALVDGLLGLSPHAGEVRFCGINWSMSDPRRVLQARRDIGRVQSRGNWMEACSVMENILLPLKHHSVVPEHALRASAVDLARSACIRAFLGRPSLVVLEYPLQAPQSDFISALIHSIEQVRRRAGAVLWITDNEQAILDTGITAEQRFQLVGSQLLDLERQHASP